MDSDASIHPFIAVRGVTKTYGGVRALSDVSLELAAGELHALCGENGAGKSTLIKVLSGVITPDAGEVLVSGRPLRLGSVAESEAARIAVIHQEVVVFPHLDVRDNVFAGREPRQCGGLLLDRGRMRRETEALLARLGERFDVMQPVGELPLAQRQMVGIARALSHRCRLLIMDEPTASLSQRETEVLFRIIRQLKSEGVCILYVSHRLEEVFALADRVTVLRDGGHVGTWPIAEMDPPRLVRAMVGRELLPTDAPGAAPRQFGGIVLDVRNLSRRGAFEDVTLQVRAGEIVGMAGLVGAGRSEVAETVFGINPPDRGSVSVAGNPVPPGSVQAAMERGLALVPEDRQHQGLILPMTVGENLTLAILRRLARCGVRSPRRERETAARLMSELLVKAAGADVPAFTLSGGNQQKLVLGKWLAANPRVLILDEPTRGVDVGAKAEIYRLIRDLAGRGLGTLLISSDLPELLLNCDRILIMRGGRISGELARAEATPEKVLELALPLEVAS
ncbi:MAG: ABC transporter ATP-binding protein [Lentisphaerae bacterium RIFOXYB12_FULL_65_16]|nr:MAG: ABC transporter ATP-binding protein [Lentisphaerae bacterium RIFOXYA12_64_32]OGV90657.1 MAG: ABC transporter ATP-binding protein [Lentisphaerae bacterium RIFOXYB12_FULL_65_16]